MLPIVIAFLVGLLVGVLIGMILCIETTWRAHRDAALARHDATKERQEAARVLAANEATRKLLQSMRIDP